MSSEITIKLAENLADTCADLVRITADRNRLQAGIDKAYAIVELSPDYETDYTWQESKRLADDCIEVFHILEELRSKPWSSTNAR